MSGDAFPDASSLVQEAEKLSTALLQERVQNGYLRTQNGALRVAAIRIFQDVQQKKQVSVGALNQLYKALNYQEDMQHGIHRVD